MQIKMFVREVRMWVVFAGLVLGANSFVLNPPPALASPDSNQDFEANPSIQIAPSTVLSTEPCQLPDAGGALFNLGALGGPQFVGGQGTGAIGTAQLVISCLRFDRSHYPLGIQWRAEYVITNTGNGPSGAFDVSGHLCRYMQNGTTLSCMSSIFDLGHYGGSLAPGESQLMLSDPKGFPLSLDPPGSYPSWEEGLPDNGVVYLRARVTTMPTGQYAVAQAIYPSAPSDSSGDPSFIDEDQDGWTPDPAHPLGGDCDDMNPDIHPGGLEYPNDGVDGDCAGGDVGLLDCEVVYGAIHGEGLLCSQPGAYAGGARDLDGDGYFDTQSPFMTPDCDDNNPFINPGTYELPDGIDNNCNGLIDEGFGIPDWVVDSALVERSFEAPHASAPYQLPGIHYQIGIGNIGDDLGPDLSIVGNAVRLRRGIDNLVLTSGLEGFAPYTQLPQGDTVACYEAWMYAQVLHTGVFGESNFSNNEMPVQLPAAGAPDLELRFSQHPDFEYQHGSTELTVLSNLEIEGTCPSLPLWAGVTPFVYINAKVLVSNIYTGEETWDSPHSEGLLSDESTIFNLPQPLSHGDIVCLEVRLDPDRLVAEDHDDNMSVQILQYKKPLIGPGHFDTYIPAYMGPFGAVSYPHNTCKDVTPASTDGALLGGSPLLPGLIAGAVLVAGLGGIGGRVAGFAADRIGWLVAAGLVLGAAGGGLLTGMLARTRSATPAETASIGVGLSTSDGVPSCDLYLDSASAYPSGGASLPQFRLGANLSINFNPNAQEPRPTSFQLALSSPSGQEAILDASSSNDEAALHLDLTSALASLGSKMLSEPGEYSWSVLSGSVQAGGDLSPWIEVCAGSNEHTFTIDLPPTDSSGPSPTPTVTLQSASQPTKEEPGSPPPTRTPKPTSPPPTRTPIPPKKPPTPTPYFP